MLPAVRKTEVGTNDLERVSSVPKKVENNCKLLMGVN